MPDEPTDAQVLADPGVHTVKEVTAAFSRSTVDEVVAAQVLEDADKGRAGILNWEPPESDSEPDPEPSVPESTPDPEPSPDPEPAPDPEPEPAPEPVGFALERVLDASEGPRIVGVVESLGRRASHPEIVGALDGYNGSHIEAEVVRQRIEDFRGRVHEVIA